MRVLGEVDREHDLRREAFLGWAVQAASVTPTNPLPAEPWAVVSEPDLAPTLLREQPPTGTTDDTTTDRGPREVRVREVLRKQGYALRKSRLRRRESSEDYGGYMIVDATRNTIEAGEKFDLSLDEVERWVREAAGSAPAAAHREATPGA